MMLLIQIHKFKALSVKKFYVAPSFLICRHLTVIEDQVFVACISPLEENFQICSFDFVLDSLSQCNNYDMDWDLHPLINWHHLDFTFESILSKTGRPLFVVCLIYEEEEKGQEININRFFLFSDQTNMVIKLPVPKVALRKLKVIVYNEPRQHIQLLAGLKNGKMMDLVAFHLKDFVLDIESVKTGLVREAVNDFHANKKRIVTFKLRSMTNLLIITFMEIDEIKTYDVEIENQIQLLSTEMSDDFVTVRTRNTKLVQQTYIYDIKKSRLFLWDREWKFKEATSFMMKFENRNFFFEFDYEKWQSGFKYHVTRIFPFDLVQIFFDEEVFGSNAKPEQWVTIDENKNKIINGEMSFTSNGVDKTTMLIKFVEDTFVLNKFYTHSVQGTIMLSDSLYMMVFGNNLPIDPLNDGILYFNEILYNKKIFQDALHGDSILSVFLFRYGNLLTQKGKYVSFNYDLELSPKAQRVELMDNHAPNYRNDFDMSKLDLRRLQQQIIYSSYLVYIVDQTRLFYIGFEFFTENSENQFFESLELPTNRICALMVNMVYCRFNPETAHLRSEEEGLGQLFYQLRPIDSYLMLEEIYTFVPNMDTMLGPLTFYYSSFSEGYFTVVQKGVRYFELLESGPEGVESMTDLRFINEINRHSIDFYQLMSGVALYVIYHEGLNVYITKKRRVFDYPDGNYLVNYKEYINTYVCTDAGFFVILYRTVENYVRGLFYQFSSNPYNRLIREILITKRGCSSLLNSIEFFLRDKNLYIIWVCKDNAQIKLWKYYNVYEMNLSLNEHREKYRIDIPGVLQQEVHFEKKHYYRTFGLKVSQVVLPEEESAVQHYDLEANNNIITYGDLVQLRMETYHPYITLVKRVRYVSVLDLEHNEIISPLFDLSVIRTSDNDYRLVTDEYILKGDNIQNNIFFNKCLKTKVVLADTDADADLKDLAVCQNISNAQYMITDFKNIKLQIEIDRRIIQLPLLVKIRDYLYLFCKTHGVEALVMYKFRYTGETEGVLPKIFYLYINLDDFSSSLHKLDYFYARYMAETDQVVILLKEMNSTVLSIKSLGVEDNFLDFERTQWVRFKYQQVERFTIIFCKSQKNHIECMAYTSPNIFIISIYFDFEWKMKILHVMPTGFNLSPMTRRFGSFINDNYLGVVVRNGNLAKMERGEFADKDAQMDFEGENKWPVINIYKLVPGVQEAEIYYSLYWKDMVDSTIGTKAFVNDMIIMRDENGTMKLIISLKNDRLENLGQIDNVKILTYDISTYQLKYDTRSMRFKDSVKLVGFDIMGNYESYELHINILRNKRVFVYILINVSMGLIFMILCLILCYFYRKNQRMYRRNREAIADLRDQLERRETEYYTEKGGEDLEKEGSSEGKIYTDGSMVFEENDGEEGNEKSGNGGGIDGGNDFGSEADEFPGTGEEVMSNMDLADSGVQDRDIS